ncbi:MAG TPA: flavodoxin family protein [Pseudobacteroides sp.]|uniref:flavodoxin family protein n=1 Tax=Pseudobacteroides sp. TaxID=1968840 RepID=UPI002F9429A0
MKILAINGSPNRNGSTAKLIEMVLDVCKEAGAQCESLHMEDYVVGECSACIKNLKDCEYCQGEEDDFMQLKAKMLDADGIVIGSPYYSGKPTVPIKIFINRIAFTCVNNRFFENKYIVGVSSSAVSNSKKIAKFCATLGHSSFMGNGIVSGLFYESTVDKVVMGDLADNEELKEKAKSIGLNLIQDIRSKRKAKFFRLKRIIFTKWIKMLCVKIIRMFDKMSIRFRKFAEEQGWVKKINKIED